MCALPSMTLSAGATCFVDDDYWNTLIHGVEPDREHVRDIIAKSLSKEPLSIEETAVLLRVENSEQIADIRDAAHTLKERVYGNRIVIFAPLYVGNECVNDCTYCGFRRSNRDAIRKTLGSDELRGQIEALENKGHKRLILVFGEHPRYDAKFIADAVRQAYSVKVGRGEIRRVNINAAPLDHEGYRTVKAAGIGTYQVFQETYHRGTYGKCHPAGTRKADFDFRLDALDRAMEAGIDDVGIGALFGLYDWRFEVLGLVAHALHLQKRFGVGCHTISFPRLQPANGVHLDEKYLVNDEEFLRLIAILRLAVPYTGMILTAREKPGLRRKALALGVSQIDAGSRIEIGGYTMEGDAQVMDREQFALGDIRSLDTVMRELIEEDYLPSFCTACYRIGRTGEHFMEFAVPGFIKRYCTPNALTTLTEYLTDYASAETRRVGEALIAREVDQIQDEKLKVQLEERIRLIRETDQQDFYF